jgi:site-specific DNA recombinase
MTRADGRHRTVEVDPVRGPLMKEAFALYATGNWTIEALAAHLTSLGLTSRATENIPSTPINETGLHRLLANPYYTGVVTLNGVRYPGQHEALVDEATWHTVQGIKSSHRNGERTRKHPHYLKGTVFVGSCGSRLIILMAKSRSGECYPYFVCSSRHKRNNCRQRSTPIDAVEKKVSKEYCHHQLSPEELAFLSETITADLAGTRDQADNQQRDLKLQLDKLER